MHNAPAILRRIISLPWLPTFLSMAGFVAYLLNALEIARTKTSFLDEGLYLFFSNQVVHDEVGAALVAPGGFIFTPSMLQV